mgnify:CR=1 FL=1
MVRFLRLAPQKDWAVNNPDELAAIFPKYQAVMDKFNGAGNGETVSMVRDGTAIW